VTHEPDRPGTQPDATRAGEGSSALDPGRVSAFLAELARAPDRDPDAALRALRPGAVVGRFELVREIGRGGFGVVFEAVDRELSRRVAFKAIRPGRRAAASPGAPAPEDAWLRKEAESAAQLAHANIVTLHDVGTSEDGPYLVLELLRGETVAERLRRGPLGPHQAVRISVEVARALAHAHAAGVLHRDLKPQNVFLCDDGAVKVLDFGLAHVLGTATRRGGGTPGYMAPEQWRGEEEDERTDLFAAAAMLHEMLSGELPYPMVSGRSAALEPGTAPVLRRPRVPRALSSLVAAGLSKDPAGRPRNAQIWLDGLFAAERALARPRRERMLLAGAAIVAAAGLAGGAFWMLRAAPGPGDRVIVSVADFRNETGESDLDGLSGMLITSLEQSRRISVLTRDRMLDLAWQVTGERPGRIDETLGREVARRAQAAAAAVATVRRFGSLYAIDVQVMDPSRDEYLFAAREQTGRKEEIPAMLDRLSERMRAGLKERVAEIQASRVRVSEAATGNLEAYQHFFRGEQLFELQQASDQPAYAAARAEYRQAVALAPDFALAHYRIAYTLEYEHMGAPAHAALARALEHLGRAAPKERSYILALAARLDGRSQDAIRQYREILDRYPGEKEAWYALASLVASRGMGYDHLHAIEYARKAIDLAPDYAPAWEQLLVSLYARDENAALLEEAQRYARAVTSVSAWEYLGHAQLVAGRDSDAERTFQRMAEVMTGSPAGPLGLALARLKRLDLAGAEAEYQQLARAHDPKRAREGHYGLAWVSAFRGRYREAAARLDAVVRADERLRDAPDLSRAHGQQVLWLTLGRGKLAEDLVRRGLAAVEPPGEPYLVYRHFYWFSVYAALAAGRLDAARRLGDQSAQMGLNHSEVVFRMAEARAQGRPDEARAFAARLYSPRDLSQGLPLYLGQWALEDGRAGEAIALASESLDMPIFPPHQDVAGFRAALWPRSLLLRARAREATGDREAARADVARLLELWKDADREAPDVVEARALAARL